MSASARQAAVLGHPIAHSLSPVMHRAAYSALGLDGWTYTAIDVPPGKLGDFIAGLDHTWAGLSVTMPHKRDIQELLVGMSDLAAQVGSVNTVLLEPASPDTRDATNTNTGAGRATGAGGVRLRGYNTDVYGIVHALAEAQGTAHADGNVSLSTAVILGGGATAASALAAVREHGCYEPVVLMRSPERADPLHAAAQRLGISLRVDVLTESVIRRELTHLGDDGAIISTLPAGAADEYVDLVCSTALAGRRPQGEHPGPALLDVVYHPWPTSLAAAWAQSSNRVSGGFAMLVHQAEGQVRLMTGRRPPLSVMRAAGQAELDRRSVVTAP